MHLKSNIEQKTHKSD